MIWPGSLSTPDCSSILLLGGDRQQVAVPAAVLLAVSPLLRSILTDLLPPAFSPCILSISATGDILQVVKDILRVEGGKCDQF